MNMVSTLDFHAIKAKQKIAWASGDYAKVGVTLQIVGEHLAEAIDPKPQMKVLDVAAGNGNVTLAMARRGARVISTDYVETLLVKGRERAEVEGLDVRFQIADAENLPFEDGEFDSVVSTFGVMFAPDQCKAASELVRVCRPGGKVAMANWTPEGFIGQLFKVIGKHAPPPKGVVSPANWGNREWLFEQFGEAIGDAAIETRKFVFRYASAERFVEVFRQWYGPVHKAYQAVGPEGEATLTRDILATVARFQSEDCSTMRVPSDYLEVVLTKA